MKIRSCLAVLHLPAPGCAWPQQANVSLDYTPQKNTDNFSPYYASPLTAHERQSWRRSLYQFAQSLFKD
jgi:hypothetical protein